MVILLGSENPSKRHALEIALRELQIEEYEIISYKVESSVPSKPIGYENIRGACNRNAELKKIAYENNISYDYLCSIEGGFSFDEDGHPYVITYSVIENKLGEFSTGTSMGIRLSREMYRYLREGHSLNKLIEKINGITNNKQSQGIVGYLTNGLMIRENVDKNAIISSFVPFLYHDERELLDEEIRKVLKKEKE